MSPTQLFVLALRVLCWGAAVLLPPTQVMAAALPLVPAFPGAEGAGALTPGGRGGRVLAVTNLADDGPGSFRNAVEAAGPRVIVFRVSGIIDLRSDIVVRNSRLTIAGQSAPGDGICLRGRSLRIEGAEDIVVRYLRIRPGAGAGVPLDGIEVRDSRNVIIDHCSISWTVDEALNTWHGVENLTVQWCLIAEPLHRSVHPKGAHGYAASLGGKDTSYHHNLFAHAPARNPSIAGNQVEHTVNLDFRCSVIFNWQHRTCDGKPVSANFINNYLRPGPATQPGAQRRIARIDDTQSAYGYASRWHIAGNVMAGAPELSDDNWLGVELDRRVTLASSRRDTAFPSAPVTTETAAEAYALVLRRAGAILPVRDDVDERIVREVAAGVATFGQGIVDSADQVGGWPACRSQLPLVDTDQDGMPDVWERRHGLNVGNPADGIADPDKDGYTSLEEFLNGTDPKQFVGNRAPAKSANPL